jgi:hypothetical protein
MNSFLTSSLPLLLPVAAVWVEKQELIIGERGTPLTESELADARRAGVASPEKIRVVRVEALPQPEDEDVMFVAKRIGFFLVHECVHVGQYERMGGIRPFLNVYLRECIDPGYPFGALEREAILVSNDICKPPK